MQRVKGRHEAIQKIEQDMMILAQLFQDLEALVVQQEPAVAQIEQKGEEVNDHVAKANTELDGAVKKARSARKKKWMCLGIAGRFHTLGNPVQWLIKLQFLLSSSSWSWWSWWSRSRKSKGARDLAVPIVIDLECSNVRHAQILCFFDSVAKAACRELDFAPPAHIAGLCFDKPVLL